jgi:hypothetical protein
MPQKTETTTASGCARIVGGLFVVWILFVLISAYARHVQLTSAVLGAFVGASLGAGVAAFVCQFSKGYCKKAQLGPLPWFGYVKHFARLRAAYLGEAPLRHSESQATGTRPPDLSEPVMATLVEPDEGPTTDKDCRALAQRFGLNYVDLDKVAISLDAIRSVPRVVAREHTILPLATNGRELRIVQSDSEPVDLAALGCILNQCITIVGVAPREKILAAINRCYPLA